MLWVSIADGPERGACEGGKQLLQRRFDLILEIKKKSQLGQDLSMKPDCMWDLDLAIKW